MKVSLNTVKQFTDVTILANELVAKINQQLGGVEQVTNLSERYIGAMIAKIVSCVDHPDADRLHVCKIDDGGVTADVERDSDGYVQVVCGAPNARDGILVVWLPPGATVPSSFGDAEPFVLSVRPLRGIASNGMLASPKELGIGDNHDGILEIDPNERRNDMADSEHRIVPGAAFARAFGLDDTLIDIENKMFTHRPDCFGVLGVAREIAGIQGQAFQSPEWYRSNRVFEAGEGIELEIRNQADDVVPRFMAVAFKNIVVGPSPIWLQTELVRLGSRPINNVVDITNYVMLLTGQPLHAYDYDKISGGVLTARRASDGESIKLLSGKTIALTSADIVIADDTRAVGLGGVMGGAESEVSDATTAIILECATFDMYTIRKTSMRHGLFTDAVTRFNKGQSPLQNPHVLGLAIRLVRDVTSGSTASPVLDVSGVIESPSPVRLNISFINDRLGLSLTAQQIKILLENVEFAVFGDDDLQVTAPFWRTDIELPEDIVEEVGRLYGFDALPRILPQRSIQPATKNPGFELKHRLRHALAQAGANEVLTYSFVNEHVLKRAEQDSDQAFSLSNALSPDLQYYRLSVLPSLLDKVHMNRKAGYNEFTLFEIGKGHNQKYHLDDQAGLPTELEFLDMVYANNSKRDGAAYYVLRAQLDAAASSLGLTLDYRPITELLDFPVTAPFDQSRSAMVFDAASQTFIGMIGELKATVVKAFKLPAYVAAATLDIGGLGIAAAATQNSYQPLSKYPKIWQDISLQVPAGLTYGALAKTVQQSLRAQESSDMRSTLEPTAIYQKSDETDTKTVTFRYRVSSDDKTMTDKQVNTMLDEVSRAASEAHQAVRI